MRYSAAARAAAVRAADWLEANPTKHIRGALTRNDRGRPTRLTNPDATCFCAVGRLSYELNPATDEGYTVVSREIGRSARDRLTTYNDYQGRTAAIEALRRIGDDQCP